MSDDLTSDFEAYGYPPPQGYPYGGGYPPMPGMPPARLGVSTVFLRVF